MVRPFWALPILASHAGHSSTPNACVRDSASGDVALFAQEDIEAGEPVSIPSRQAGACRDLAGIKACFLRLHSQVDRTDTDGFAVAGEEAGAAAGADGGRAGAAGGEDNRGGERQARGHARAASV